MIKPIKDVSIVREFKKYVKDNSLRDYLLLEIGFNTGLRIGDIVQLQVNDVYGKEYVVIEEEKSGDVIEIYWGNIQSIVDDVIDDMGINNNTYIFESRQRDSNGVKKHISKTQGYRVLKKYAKEFGLNNFGTHTLRKTFAYHFYKNTGDLLTLMNLLDHKTITSTLHYIDVLYENKDTALKGFYL